MTPGKAYLLHQGDWHTFVGRCVAQTGPFTYLFHYVSQIQDTNDGPVWNRLAAGDASARKKATYTHEQTPQEFPLTIRASLWIGKTPAEEAGIKMIGVEKKTDGRNQQD